MAEMQEASITPEQYFEHVVPGLLNASPNHSKSIGPVFVVRLFGEPSTEWTIDVNKKCVTQGGVKYPNFYLEMDRADFVALMLQELDVYAAILGGRIRFEGRLSQLEYLADLLDPVS